MLSSDKLAQNKDSGQFVTAKKGEHHDLPAWGSTCKKGHKKSAMSNWEGTTNSSQEELYQLLAHPEGSTQPFIMMVHLTPEIVDDLKHAEAEGVMPRMKFGDNVDGHVIEVGRETFKFSSVPEPVNACYIYAEQAHENGKHFLREVGSSWRQLSVQHIRRFIENEQCTSAAENKQKLQKSTLMDQNTQLSSPQIALAEVDEKKSVPGMGKEPPPKKRKVTNCPLPSVHKQLCSTDQIGNQYVSTPASLSPELVSAVVKGVPETPLVALPCWKGKATNGGEAFQPLSKARSTQKERALTTTMSTGSNINVTDIHNLLISLLQETPKGMTIKALEKVVTEKLAVSPQRKWIEKIIKSIATFHAPGKYILNPGVEKGTFVDASIGSSGKSNETATIETKPFTDSVLEAISQKELNLDLPKASHKSNNSPANEHFSPKPVHSHITNEFAGKSPRNEAMNAEAIASRSSDLSSTNESESESGTSSKGSATSSSESSSGSESDVSTSSSESSMDEDVDIMSDGEDEMKSDLSHQKLKTEDLKLLVVKEASKLQDDFENTEEIDSKALEKGNASLEIQSNFPQKLWPPLEDTKVKERECMADSLLETEVFGPDKDPDVTLDSPVPLKADNLKESLNSSSLRDEATCGVSVFSKMPVNKQIDTFPETVESYQEQGHGNQEQRKRISSNQSTSPSQMVARAEKRAKQLDIMVDKICEDKDAVSTTSWGVKLGAHQINYQSSSCKVSEMIEKEPVKVSEMIEKEPVEHSIKQEARLPTRKANSNYNTMDDNLSSKNSSLSLKVSSEIFVGSSLKAKDRLQKVGRPSREASRLQGKQHSSIKPDKLTTTNQRKKHGEADKHDASRGRSSECNERVAPKTVSINSGLVETSKSARNFQKGSKELPGKDDRSGSKEEVSKRSLQKLTNPGETLPRRGKSLKARQCPRKEAGTNKSTALGSTRELGNVHDALELVRINKDTQKASQRSSLEWAERTSSFEEQGGRPKNDADLQGRDSKTENGLKETGLKARPPNDGILSSIASKEGRTMDTANADSGQSSRSGHAFSRSSFHESKRYDSQDLELGEFREPLSENELGESKRPSSLREKHCFEATSRITSSLKSVSPSSKKRLLLSKSRLEASPAQGENNFLQEMRSQEMITQDAESASPYRPLNKTQGAVQSKQKLGADGSKQSQRGGSVSTNKCLRGSTRSGGSDLQNHTAGSKEISRKHSDKLLGGLNGSAFSQQKESDAICLPKKKKLREDHKAKDSRISCKKQTPQSSEVHGSDFFVLYEKEEPELRGAIYSLEQLRDYYQEFNEKYPIYTQLNASLENDKENFEMFWKDFKEAELRGDIAKLAVIQGMIRKEYFQCRKRSKRMRHTFKVLHEELQVIKQQCKDYAQKSRR